MRLDQPLAYKLIEKYGKQNLFGLLVRGDSIDKIVLDGYYAILVKANRVESREILAVIVNGYEVTLKRVMKLNRGILLEPYNHKADNIPMMYLDEQAHEEKIIGKIVHIIVLLDVKFK